MTASHTFSVRRSCAAVAVGLFACTVPAQDIILTNLANTPRKQWVDVALPAVDAAPLPALCRFEPGGWIAYKGRHVGMHSVVFHVLADLAPQQRVVGSLVPVTADASSFVPWGPSDWVGDNLGATFPLPVVLDTQGVEHRLVTPNIQIVEAVSPARRVFRISGRVGDSPLVYDAFAYVYAGQDAVRTESTFTCADPRMASMEYEYTAVWLESGDYQHIDYRTRLSLPQPILQTSQPAHPSFGKWVSLLSGPRFIGRGEGFSVSGSTFAFLSPGASATTTGYATNGMGIELTVGDRINALVAQSQLPALGLWRHWEGKWLAFGTVPEIPTPFRWDGGVSHSNASWFGFQSLMQQPADIFAPRPRGMVRWAAATGSQEDFGACKGGLAVSVEDPRFIYDCGYSVAETMMRGFHYREVTGSRMLQQDHPGLQLFAQVPNCRTTYDTVGYPCPLPNRTSVNGWSAWDDQHRSHNNFNAVLALTGSWTLSEQIRDLAEVDKCIVPGWSDSPRAEGRLAAAWANMYLMMDDPTERAQLRALMLNRLNSLRNNWPGRQFVGNAAKPIRAMYVGSDGAFLEADGTRVPAIIVWEHSIALMGYYAAWRVTGDQGYLDMVRDLSNLIVNHCVFLQNGQWHAATAIRYLDRQQEGDPLPASAYYIGSPHVYIGVHTFWSWILPSVLICREVWGDNPALVERCSLILNNVAPNGPSNWEHSEWWAVAPR